MKRFYLLLVVGLFISVHSFGQIKMGIKVGGNLANMKFDIDHDFGDEPETKFKMGFHAGLIADILIIKNKLSLQPAFLYSNKGYSTDFEQMLEDELDDDGIDLDDYKGYVRNNYNYLELPVNVVFKYDDFQFFAGPYLALGIGGKFNHDFSFEADDEDFDSDDFFDEDSYKIRPVIGKVDDNKYEDLLEDDDIIDIFRAFDMGYNLGVGYQFKNVMFNAGYSFGFVNLTPRYDADDFGIDEDYTENVIQKNRVFTFSVSYFFNKEF